MAWFATHSGRRLWYDECGAGTPIVFIHGWCMSSDVWRLQLEKLPESFRVITIDLQGHGRSSPQGGSFHIKGCAADISELCKFLDIHNALLAGWSLGGLIALETFDLLRGRLSGLILIAGTPRFTQGDGFPYGLSKLEVDGMIKKVQRSMRRALDGFRGRMFASGELDHSEQTPAIQELLSAIPLPSTDVALQALDVLVQSDLRNRLALIDLPALIVSGDRDVICLPQASEYMAQQISSARQIVFAGCGHAPFLTQSARFNECLEEFREMVSGREH